jgi:predicted DNA-binding transcriptional regulator YafY
MRDRAEAAANAVVFDPQGWDGPFRHVAGALPEPEHLVVLQDAVVDARQIWLDYVDRHGAVTRRQVDPFGLVAKAGRWYLVAGTAEGQRTFRVDRVRGAETTGAPAVRPDGFDLGLAWAGISERIDEMRLPVRARILVHGSKVAIIGQVFGARHGLGAAGPDGRVEMEVRGWGEYPLAVELAGFGAAVEVLGPDPIRSILARIGAELVATYAADE